MTQVGQVEIFWVTPSGPDKKVKGQFICFFF